MATRCNVIIRVQDGPEWILYRHWDGYPAETGRHLARVAAIAERKRWSAGQFVAALLGARENNPDPYRGNRRRPHYEPTTGVHGDVEHVYCVDIEPRQDASPKIRIGHGGRAIFEAAIPAVADPLDEAEKFARVVTHRVACFARLVINPEIRAQNQRIVAWSAQTGRHTPRQIREFSL